MGDARDWAHSDVLVEEFRGSEICEHFTVVDAIVLVFLFLLEAVELSKNDSVHALEHVDKVLRLLLENRVLSQSSELLVASARPVLNLIVNDVNFLESLLDLLIVTVNKSQVLIHLNELSVVFVRSRGLINIIRGIDLQLLQPLGQLFVIFLKVVNFGLARRNSLQKGRVGLFTDLESANHSLNISHTCVCLDLLEGVVNGTA